MIAVLEELLGAPRTPARKRGALDVVVFGGNWKAGRGLVVKSSAPVVEFGWVSDVPDLIWLSAGPSPPCVLKVGTRFH